MCTVIVMVALCFLEVVHYAFPTSFPIDPNIVSSGNGEWNCLSVVEHVTGDEKYE